MRWTMMLGAVVGLMLAAPPAQAALVERVVEYQDGDTVLEGYLAYDDIAADKQPGVLVVHEWKGLNDYAKRRARQLADLGYVAFAADIYGKGVRAETHEEAGKLSGIYRNDRNLMRGRIMAAYDWLKGQPFVNPDKIAAIGYCFGGSTVLELARMGTPVKGVVSFHGGLSTPMPAKPGVVKAKVLALNGAADTYVPPQERADFEKEMKNAGVDYRLILYPGAVHSFTVPEAGDDPSKGMAYNAQADQKSWEEMQKFLKQVFES